MPKKPKAQFFQTVTDMRAVPAEKIDHFVEDLRLWLHMHKQIDRVKADLGNLGDLLKITTPEHRFGWVDDGKHEANISVTFSEQPETLAGLTDNRGNIEQSDIRAQAGDSRGTEG